MFSRGTIKALDDYFFNLEQRAGKEVYFYRIDGCHDGIHQFLLKYYGAARTNGVIVEGKIQNPDNHQLDYYYEMMGQEFRFDRAFIEESLKKWLPRMNCLQRADLAQTLFDSLLSLQRLGKNENILKNAYIKLMCWLYYKFERLISHVGESSVPKILLEGSAGMYELLLMDVLSKIGCDIVLLQHQGEETDAKTELSPLQPSRWEEAGLRPFPADFDLKALRLEVQKADRLGHLLGGSSGVTLCTNSWMRGEVLENLRLPAGERGSDKDTVYNCFLQLDGVEDKNTYLSDLYQLQLQMKKAGRRLLILNGQIDRPSPEEIARIHRGTYRDLTELIADLSRNISFPLHPGLEGMMKRAFAGVLMAEEGNNPLSRTTSQAVTVLCFLQRYQAALFRGFKVPETACFFYMGGCQNHTEELFCSLLARLPVDVVLLNPGREERYTLQDPLLKRCEGNFSMEVRAFPEEDSSLRVGTAAFHAEQDLDSFLYRDTGLYRSHQYGIANTVTLRTMLEEIPLLWKQELKYRPHFSVVENVANIPVLLAKISGVKDGNVTKYWQEIKALMDEDTLLVTRVPHLTAASFNPVKPYAPEFLKNGRVQKDRIKNHKCYEYGFLREPMQDYMLEKMQRLLEDKTIKGTFENGTEYTIVSTCLHISKKILKLIQKFDFTKKNPKIIYICTSESQLSLEDTITVMFLNQLGFDILFFVPTGYQCVERYLAGPMVEEHQAGDYLYDLEIPNFETITVEQHTKLSLKDRILRGIINGS